nr:S8 family serine peptidase [Chloroflexota bacterium]
GINYYHADFGGLRDPEFTADTGLDRSDGNFPTAKVVAGYDLVGDAYNPGSDVPGADIPVPDNDPLDCKDPDAPNVHHGTHVAGTAAGQGVLDNGDTFTGPYDEDTLADHTFRIGPGTAPEASLMAFRVFGCDGATFVVVDAIERATRAGADVINMSLGSPFGNPGSVDSLAVDGASKAGVTVVMSAGNSGPSAYITGSPGVATRGISVAAMDAVRSFPAATVEIAGGDDIDGIIANDDTDDLPVTGDLNVFADNPATPCDGDTGAGCEESGVLHDSYVFNAYVAGQIPVTFRGNGARVDRASQGDAEGAPAVIMVNNAPGFPPFEGPIEGADIPFVGVSSTAAAALAAADGDSATITDAGVTANPNFKHTASFTSGGPRRFDNMIKPDVAAPGVSVISAHGGTVDGPRILSGTSMASPAAAGVAALVLEANPGWTPKNVKSALMGTASPNRLVPYEIRLAGAGLVNPRRAVGATGLAWAGQTTASLAFGAEQLGKDPNGSNSFRETLSFNITNKSSSSVTYQLSNQFQTASLGANVSISPNTVTIGGNSSRSIDVTLRMSEADAEALPDTAPLHGPDLGFDSLGQLHSPLTHVAGAVVANVIGGSGNDIRVPYLLAPRGLSRVNDRTKTAYTETANRFKSSVRVKNTGVHFGIADVYQWGLADGNDGLDGIDIRAVGVQTFPTEVCNVPEDRDDRCLVIAVNTWNKWGNASENEFDVLIDTNDDDEPDYAVIGVDAGLVLGGLDGIYVSLIVDLPALSVVDAFFATAPNDGATMLLPLLASDLGLSRTGDSDFEY